MYTHTHERLTHPCSKLEFRTYSCVGGVVINTGGVFPAGGVLEEVRSLVRYFLATNILGLTR